MHIKWLGHATFLLEEKDFRIIIDPWIEGNPSCPVKLKELPKINHIVVTHDHGDHLGNAIDIAREHRAKIIAIYDLAQDLSSKGVEVVGANIGGWFVVDNVEYQLTPAFHSSIKGSPCGVLVKIKDTIIYHAGDTGLFAEMSLLGELYRIKVALLPIGGLFTMGPYEAAKAVELLRPEIVVPMHYNTFPQIKQDPEHFKKLVMARTPWVEVVILKPGEVLEV
ncbi:MAG: metal-dependent hydrolase [Thermoprotei archaeon]|nr:MAG: metal-dependent hydrolase [Thermoprotei archaeon]RLF24508.1 MAG: metal-dependent hydrolase [Thermoprotei archaeon]